MTRDIAIPLWVLVLVGVALAIVIIIVWSIKRKRKVHLRIESAAGMKDLLLSVVGLTQGTLVGGNRIDLLQNGEFFDALYEEMEKADETINFETFLAKPGAVTTRIADILASKSIEGVAVRILVDGNIKKKFGKENFNKMRDAGVHARSFHPWAFGNLGRMNNRDHRKIVVVDGRVAFVGGHCLVDSWLGKAEDKEHFRDISIRIEGPLVYQIQGAFSENWIQETGDVPGGDSFFPEIDPVGDIAGHAVFVSPSGMPSTVKLMHYLVIQAAKECITIQNPYFLPDPEAREALVKAVKRGVKVRVMLPSTAASDMPIVQHASHHHFGHLLEGGVRIWEYEKTLLHQKVMTIDHCWSSIGSTNFDDRSFEVNDEISVGISDERIARKLEDIFEDDLKHSKEWSLKDWKHRSIGHKLKDGTLYLINEQL